MAQNNHKDNTSGMQPPKGNNASPKKNNKPAGPPKIPSYLLDWARAQLDEDEIRMAELLADFIVKNVKNSSPLLEKVKDFGFVKQNLFFRGYISNPESCVNLFIILLARIKGWEYPDYDKQNSQISLKDSFYPEVQAYMTEDGLDTSPSKQGNLNFPVYIPEKIFQMLLCHLWVERQIIDVNDDGERQTRMEAARKKFLKKDEYMFGQCLKELIRLLQNYSPKSKEINIPNSDWAHQGPWKFLAEAKKVRNKFAHGRNVTAENRGAIFTIYLYTIFTVAACEMVLEAETKERVILCSPDCERDVEFKYQGEDQMTNSVRTNVPKNECVKCDLKKPGTYSFIAEQNFGKKSTSATKKYTVERGKWLDELITIYLSFNTQPDEVVPDNPIPTPNTDSASETIPNMPNMQDEGKTEDVSEDNGLQKEGVDNFKNEREDETQSESSKEAKDGAEVGDNNKEETNEDSPVEALWKFNCDDLAAALAQYIWKVRRKNFKYTIDDKEYVFCLQDIKSVSNYFSKNSENQRKELLLWAINLCYSSNSGLSDSLFRHLAEWKDGNSFVFQEQDLSKNVANENFEMQQYLEATLKFLLYDLYKVRLDENVEIQDALRIMSGADRIGTTAEHITLGRLISLFSDFYYYTNINSKGDDDKWAVFKSLVTEQRNGLSHYDERLKKYVKIPKHELAELYVLFLFVFAATTRNIEENKNEGVRIIISIKGENGEVVKVFVDNDNNNRTTINHKDGISHTRSLRLKNGPHQIVFKHNNEVIHSETIEVSRGSFLKSPLHIDISLNKPEPEPEPKPNPEPKKETLWNWCLAHKRWGAIAAGVLAVLLVGTIAFKAINASEPDRRPEVVADGGTYPPLDGKTWIVREKNGGKIPAGKGRAEIRSMNFEATDYSMIVMTEMGPEEYHFSYDRQKGTLSSPELGEGHVEKGHRIYKLKIIFEGWILEIM